LGFLGLDKKLPAFCRVVFYLDSRFYVFRTDKQKY